MTVLDEILEATRAECVRLRRELPADVGHRPRPVAPLLSRGPAAPLRLIAEFKRRSPSAGALSTTLSIEERIAAYDDAGATMISVLVDRTHFDGGYDDLSRARRATDRPLLAKGFAIDEIQIEAARRSGADAILLIARILDDEALRGLAEASKARELTPIVEVVDEAELARAEALAVAVVGVNARDLATLQFDRARAARVAASIADERVALWFSGLATADDVSVVARQTSPRRLDGALIGETLMRQEDPRPLLSAMVAAARG
jgi:indole-3-glycerol phosphate synthase